MCAHHRWPFPFPTLSLPLFSAAFVCHFNVLPVHAELARPTRPRLQRVLHAAIGSCPGLNGTPRNLVGGPLPCPGGRGFDHPPCPFSVSEGTPVFYFFQKFSFCFGTFGNEGIFSSSELLVGGVDPPPPEFPAQPRSCLVVYVAIGTLGYLFARGDTCDNVLARARQLCPPPQGTEWIALFLSFWSGESAPSRSTNGQCFIARHQGFPRIYATK